MNPAEKIASFVEKSPDEKLDDPRVAALLSSIPVFGAFQNANRAAALNPSSPLKERILHGGGTGLGQLLGGTLGATAGMAMGGKRALMKGLLAFLAGTAGAMGGGAAGGYTAEKLD